MPWETKIKFGGQVKTVGVEKNMTWKTGFVAFDHDSSSDTWLARLYWKVNPNRVYHEMKIGPSNQPEVKCGRLMIENKRGDGIHLRLGDSDKHNAQILVSKIKSSVFNTPKHSNKAEVGVSQNGNLSQRKGSENVSPYRSSSYLSDASPVPSIAELPPVNSGGWLSKKTPPIHYKDSAPASKRRLALPSPDRQRNGSVLKEDEADDDMLLTSSRFTGMKDYSKRTSGNALSLTNGLGAKSFYGAENSLMKDNSYRGLGRVNNSSTERGGVERSPILKRARLSSSFGSKNNRMLPPTPNPHGPIGGERSSRPPESSVIQAEQPNRPRDGQTVGFDNLGNTCFLNSPLQCLSSLEPFSLDIQSAVAHYGSQLKPHSITRMLYLLMKDVRKQDVSEGRVRDILKRLRQDMNKKFEPYTQQDAHELLNELLDRVDSEVKGVIQSREQQEARSAMAVDPDSLTPTEVNFNWFYKTSLYFHECKTEITHDKVEEEIILLLAIDSETLNIQDCIDKYFASTVLDVMCERCGKREKATVTRKIVRRPRIFILNLLRYQTDKNTSQKKQDTVNILSHISIAEYCADDVKAPTPMQPVFLLDRIPGGDSQAKMPKSDNKAKALATTTASVRTLPQETRDGNIESDHRETKDGTGANEAGGVKGESQAEGKELFITMDTAVETAKDEYAAVGLYAELVNECCEEVYRYIEMAEKEGDSVDNLHEFAATLIQETRALAENELSMTLELGPDLNIRNSKWFQSAVQSSLCVNLVKIVLDSWSPNSGPSDGLSDDDWKSIIEEVKLTRYVHIHGKSKQREHFIQELGLYLAAKKLGLVKPDSPLLSKSDKNVMNKAKDGDNTSICGLHGSDDESVEPSNESSGCSRPQNKSGDGQKKVTFKNTEPLKRDDNETKDSKELKSEKTIRNMSTQQGHSGNEGVFSTQAWPNNYQWDGECEHSDTGTWDGTPVSNSNGTDNASTDNINDDFAHDIDDLGKELLLGRELNTYTEAELSQMDPNALTFDEMMLYARAMSSYNYISETRKRAQDEIDGEIAMELCETSEDNSGADSGEAAGQASNHLMISQSGSSQKSGSGADLNAEVSRMTKETASSASVLTPPSSTTSPETTGHVETALTLGKEPKLFCDEDLSDLDDATVPDIGDNNSRSPLLLSGQNGDLSVSPVFAIADTNDIADEQCMVCGQLFQGACSFCLDQADFGSQPLDTHFTVPDSNLLFSDHKQESGSAVLSPSKFVANQCNTVSSKEPTVTPTKSNLKHHPEQCKFPSPSYSAEKSSKSSDSNSDHVVPGSPFANTKKDPFLFSPTKANNLVKTRDYARLRSPSASPKKRTNKAQPSKSPSATKRLHFTEGEKCTKPSVSGPDEKIKDSSDCADSPNNTDNDTELASCVSIEVNVDDTSFLGHIDSCSTTSPSVCSTTPLSLGGNTSLFSPSTKSSSTPVSVVPSSIRSTTHNPLDKTSSPASRNTISDPPRVFEEPTAHQQISPVNQHSAMDKTGDHSEATAPSARSRKVSFSEHLTENTNPEKSTSFIKSKTHRSLIDSFGNAEEKENKPEDQARLRRMENIENGRADLSYRLVGVVNHIGDSLFAGHYTAFAYNISQQAWFYMNDNHTKEANEAMAQKGSSKSGYVVFYMDKDLFHKYQAKINESRG